MVASMTPSPPGAWLTVPRSVAVRKMTSTVTKPTVGIDGSRMYIAIVTRLRSKAPMPICTSVKRRLGKTIRQRERPTARRLGVSQSK